MSLRVLWKDNARKIIFFSVWKCLCSCRMGTMAVLRCLSFAVRQEVAVIRGMSPAGDMPRITATSCRTANDRHRKTAIVPIRQEHKHFQTEKKIIFRALSFQRTRRLTADDSGTTSYPQPSAQFRPTGAHDILHDTQGSSPRFAPHVASSSDNAATISTDKIHSRTVFHYRPLPTKKTRETLWISLVK